VVLCFLHYTGRSTHLATFGLHHYKLLIRLVVEALKVCEWVAGKQGRLGQADCDLLLQVPAAASWVCDVAAAAGAYPVRAAAGHNNHIVSSLVEAGAGCGWWRYQSLTC
jgi:hypothetical protein